MVSGTNLEPVMLQYPYMYMYTYAYMDNLGLSEQALNAIISMTL